MSKAGGDEIGGGSSSEGAHQPESPSEKVLSKLSATTLPIGHGWTKVSCPCCVSERVEPLVLVKLGEKVRPETKRWLMRLIGAPQKDGGAGLLAHPGKDASGNIIVVSAPRCTLLRATEELGLCKTYRNEDMAAFSYNDRDNFKDSDNMEMFLTLAERQYIVKYELDGMRAQRDLRVPGLADSYTLQHRDNIWQKLGSAGVIVDMFPLHIPGKLKDLSKAWYSGNQLAQPLDSVNGYFGSSVAFYFSFLDFYTWSLLPPAILGLSITYFSGEVQKDMESVSGSGVTRVEDESAVVSGHMIQAVFSILWSTIFMELWKRRSASLSYRWGTLNLAERFAEPRPGFHGEVGVNPVTGRVEPLFPEWQRDLRMALVSVPVVGLCLENHREESAFENHLTAKVLVFTFFNYFAVLFHIAFFKQDVPLLRKRLASLLIVTQLVNQFTEVVIPYMVDRFISAPYRTESEDDPEEDKFRNQSNLPAFPGLFAEYIELLVQFGYLSLFSCVYPLTALLLLINNVTEIRTDAYKICKLFRKPFSPPVANMGVWQIAFEVLSFASVVTNCWLMLLSPQLQELFQGVRMSSTNILLLAVLVEHVLILVKVILALLIPDEPNWIRKKRERIEYTSMQALRQQRQHSEES